MVLLLDHQCLVGLYAEFAAGPDSGESFGLIIDAFVVDSSLWCVTIACLSVSWLSINRPHEPLLCPIRCPPLGLFLELYNNPSISLQLFAVPYPHTMWVACLLPFSWCGMGGMTNMLSSCTTGLFVNGSNRIILRNMHLWRFERNQALRIYGQNFPLLSYLHRTAMFSLSPDRILVGTCCIRSSLLRTHTWHACGDSTHVWCNTSFIKK